MVLDQLGQAKGFGEVGTCLVVLAGVEVGPPGEPGQLGRNAVQAGSHGRGALLLEEIDDVAELADDHAAVGLTAVFVVPPPVVLDRRMQRVQRRRAEVPLGRQGTEGLDGLVRLPGIADAQMLRTGGCGGCRLSGTCRVCRPLAKVYPEAKAPLNTYCQHGSEEAS